MGCHLVIKALFAIFLCAIYGLHLSEDKIRPTSCSVRAVGWLVYILGWQKIISGKVRSGFSCPVCPRGSGHADEVAPSPSAHPSAEGWLNAAVICPRVILQH